MENKKSHRYCVIMCGGVGSRFWPLSRTDMPKQFLDFFGTGRSLLQLTYDRIRPLVDADNIILVTNSAYLDIIRTQLPDVKMSNILLEPARRNTAPCVCWAAHHIAALDPEANIVTLPSDHLILKEDAFRQTILEALDFSESHDALVTIGLKPLSPHTGYGYIQQGPQAKDCPGIMKVKSFTEKPNLEMATLFLNSGEFFWNSGMFVWRAASILEAFEKYDPETATIFDAGLKAFGTPEEMNFINSTFTSAPAVSIDYAIMEKADNVYVKIADLGWSDLGSWSALYEVSPKNQFGNVTQNCNVLANDCENTIFAVEGDKIVVASGLSNFIVADTGNALLIYPRCDEQRIRQVVNDVRARFGEKYI